VYIDTGSPVPNIPSKSCDLAAENKKFLTEWKWFETTVNPNCRIAPSCLYGFSQIVELVLSWICIKYLPLEVKNLITIQLINNSDSFPWLRFRSLWTFKCMMEHRNKNTLTMEIIHLILVLRQPVLFRYCAQ
jgi:hypothetical protein